ncbi:unnamed protein product [Amoebophrya sp. A25]|nr:unnamed protein product [Amoebophrya sp. A25]|eukprot:GSA25T00002644001.1
MVTAVAIITVPTGTATTMATSSTAILTAPARAAATSCLSLRPTRRSGFVTYEEFKARIQPLGFKRSLDYAMWYKAEGGRALGFPAAPHVTYQPQWESYPLALGYTRGPNQDRRHDIASPGEEYHYQNKRCMALEDTTTWFVEMIEEEAPGRFEFKRLPRYARGTVLFRCKDDLKTTSLALDQKTALKRTEVHDHEQKVASPSFCSSTLDHIEAKPDLPVQRMITKISPVGKEPDHDHDHDSKSWSDDHDHSKSSWSALLIKSAASRRSEKSGFSFKLSSKEDDIGVVLACEPEGKLLICAPSEIKFSGDQSLYVRTGALPSVVEVGDSGASATTGTVLESGAIASACTRLDDVVGDKPDGDQARTERNVGEKGIASDPKKSTTATSCNGVTTDSSGPGAPALKQPREAPFRSSFSAAKQLERVRKSLPRKSFHDWCKTLLSGNSQRGHYFRMHALTQLLYGPAGLALTEAFEFGSIHNMLVENLRCIHRSCRLDPKTGGANFVLQRHLTSATTGKMMAVPFDSTDAFDCFVAIVYDVDDPERVRGAFFLSKWFLLDAGRLSTARVGGSHSLALRVPDSAGLEAHLERRNALAKRALDYFLDLRGEHIKDSVGTVGKLLGKIREENTRLSSGEDKCEV